MKGHWEVFTVGNLTRYLLNENDMSEFLFFFNCIVAHFCCSISQATLFQ